MTNNIQCSIESSTTKIELNSAAEGVFLVPELEGLAGLPEIRTTSGVNAGYDGGWTSAQNYDARLISIRGIIANPDVAQVEAKRRAIASLLGQGRKEQLTLRITTEAGNSYAISVRTISCEMALQRVLTTQEFLIQLRADDPLIYDDGASAGTEAILHVQRALGGFEINFELPLAIGGGAESTTVENGAEMVYPIIKMYGPLHSPTVVNTTTNQQMQLNADLQYTVTWSGYQNENIGSSGQIDVAEEIAGSPMSLTKLNGNAEQTTYSGKNLWSLDSSYTNTTTGGKWVLSDTAVSIPAGTYTFSSTVSVVGSANSINCKYADGVDNIISIQNGTATMTFTEEVKKVAIRLAGSATISNIQLEAGSTATSYEPYVGGTASPNPDYPQAIETVTGGQTVEVVGKNMFGGLTFYSSANIESWSLENNIITFTPSNTTGNPNLYFKLASKIPANSTVHLSCDGPISTSTQLRDSSLAIAANFGSNNNITRTLSGDGVYFVLNWASDGTTTTKTVNLQTLQLEFGSQATTYTAYQGWQSYEVNLGKNLNGGYPNSLSITRSGVNFTNNADGTISASGTATDTNALSMYGANATDAGWIRTYQAGTYTLSGGSSSISVFLTATDGSTSHSTNFTSNSVTFTLTEPQTAYIRIQVKSGKTVNETIYPQLERGSQATSYASYFTPIELAKIGTYQDYIWNDDGTWKIHHATQKLRLLSTNNWSGGNFFDNAPNLVYFYSTQFDATLPNISAVNDNTSMSTFAKPATSFYTGSPATFFGDGKTSLFGWDATVTNANRLRLAIASSFLTGGTNNERLASWKSQLDVNDFYIIAPLNSSLQFDTEITEQALIDDLDTISELYGGQNNIMLVPSIGAQGTMEVKYPTVKTITQDVAVIDSQARTITINGQDAYHLKTDESEFLLLAPGENKLYLTSASETDEGYAEVKFKQGYLSI